MSRNLTIARRVVTYEATPRLMRAVAAHCDGQDTERIARRLHVHRSTLLLAFRRIGFKPEERRGRPRNTL